jgi:uncharacterized protein (TIGR02996 family)
MTPDPFLQAIIAEPDENAPRLIYADWLEEQGDQDLAEFIRVQCELDHLEPSDRRGKRLRERVQSLIRQHGEVWAGPLRQLDCYWYLRFKRGFIYSVEVEAQEFLDHVPEFFARHPLQVIEFRRVEPGHLSAIAQCPQLARLRELRFNGGMGPGEGAVLAQSPFLVSLERLDIRVSGFGTDGLKTLASSPHLSRLGHFALVGTSVETAGLEALAASQRLPQLRSLLLSATEIGDQGVEVLAGGPLLGQLISLSLGRNPFGDAGAAALARSPYLHLEELNLSNTRITDAGFHSLAASSGLLGLKVLLIGNQGIGTFSPGAIRYLAESPHLGALEELHFTSSHLGDEGTQALAGRLWRHLHSLYLGQCGIGDIGLQALSESPVLGAVTTLWLYENRIGDAGAMALAKSPYLINLKDLDLRGNRIGKEARQIVRDRFGKRHCRFTR